jgi:hypothetical protein
LATDEPSKRTTYEEAYDCENGGANQQTDVVMGNGRANADGKQATNAADNCACHRAYVRFSEAGFPH